MRISLILCLGLVGPLASCEKADGRRELRVFAVIAGEGQDNNSATGIAVDNDGSVYVVGDVWGPTDFDSDGIWDVDPPEGPAVFVAKYGAAGNLVWVSSAAGSGDWRGYGVAVDRYGSVYINGNFEGVGDFDQDGIPETSSIGGTDIFVARYSPDGALMWVRSGGGPQDDRTEGIALDAEGNVYIAGTFLERADLDADSEPDVVAVGSEDMFVATYSSSGAFRWAKSAGGAGWDRGGSVQIDSAGNVYVTGCFQGSADFDGDGEAELTSRVSGYHCGHGVAVDARGHVFVTGAYETESEFSDIDMFLAKYDAEGTLQWARSLGQAPGADSRAGNGFVAMYDAEGRLAWVRSGPGPANPRAIAVDRQGNAYVTGNVACDLYEYPEDEERGVFVALYDRNGTRQWHHTADWTAPTDNTTYPACNGRGVGVDQDGRVYVAGWYTGTLDVDGDGAPDLTARPADAFVLALR